MRPPAGLLQPAHLAYGPGELQTSRCLGPLRAAAPWRPSHGSTPAAETGDTRGRRAEHRLHWRGAPCVLGQLAWANARPAPAVGAPLLQLAAMWAAPGRRSWLGMARRVGEGTAGASWAHYTPNAAVPARLPARPPCSNSAAGPTMTCFSAAKEFDRMLRCCPHLVEVVGGGKQHEGALVSSGALVAHLWRPAKHAAQRQEASGDHVIVEPIAAPRGGQGRRIKKEPRDTDPVSYQSNFFCRS